MEISLASDLLLTTVDIAIASGTDQNNSKRKQNKGILGHTTTQSVASTIFNGNSANKWQMTKDEYTRKQC